MNIVILLLILLLLFGGGGFYMGGPAMRREPWRDHSHHTDRLASDRQGQAVGPSPNSLRLRKRSTAEFAETGENT